MSLQEQSCISGSSNKLVLSVTSWPELVLLLPGLSVALVPASSPEANLARRFSNLPTKTDTCRQTQKEASLPKSPPGESSVLGLSWQSLWLIIPRSSLKICWELVTDYWLINVLDGHISFFLLLYFTNLLNWLHLNLALCIDSYLKMKKWMLL